ncbi:putative glycosyltransferase 2 [Platanthera zijinensis]|uniref:Glycosyltransferase 2 n=1 Tax=Platanthera zijinensis TaxID=2320716 RepID=A0AAP0FXF6_9ASPA
MPRWLASGLPDLHGYWGILVDRYEEMLENYNASFGDHRWPVVTHFVGCKPCDKFGDYLVEHCLKQRDMAFNFGDNQILQITNLCEQARDEVRDRQMVGFWDKEAVDPQLRENGFPRCSRYPAADSGHLVPMKAYPLAHPVRTHLMLVHNQASIRGTKAILNGDRTSF